MRRFFFPGILLLITLSCSYLQSGFDVGAEGTIERPADYAMGTLRMYSFDEISLPEPPRGYKPFMISHYGRHGARFHGDDTQGKKVYAVLDSAHLGGHLTPLGEELYAYICLFYDLYPGHAADLTQKGREQQRLLAERMKKNYPSVFLGKTFIEARSTPVPRCILSMGAFCDGLGVWVHQSASKAYSPILAPQLSLPGFEERSRRSWAVARAAATELIDPSAFLERVFGNAGYEVPSYPSEVSFMRNVYYLLSNAPCLDVDLPKAPEVFKPEEWESLWEVDNLVYYAGGYASEEGVTASASLWQDIVERADNGIASGGLVVDLRFGHDSHLMSLLSYLGVKEWTGRVDDLESVKDVWQNWRIPMAANLQIVFYRHPRKDDILVRFLLNEKPIELSNKAVEPGFYLWDEVKEKSL